jgi:hypothetical protein
MTELQQPQLTAHRVVCLEMLLNLNLPKMAKKWGKELDYEMCLVLSPRPLN